MISPVMQRLKCAALAGFAALVLTGPLAAADPTPAPLPDNPGILRPLGPAKPSFPTSLPEDRNAFPAPIMARMREALVAQAENPRDHPVPVVRSDD